jgi:hypothetical protein
MLATRYRANRNSYFQFEPFHTLFSLVGAFDLVWFSDRVSRSAGEIETADQCLTLERSTAPLSASRNPMRKLCKRC